MSELDEIQAFIASQLRRRRALPSDPATTERARAVIADTGRLSPVQRLEIYREQFWLRHTSSLVEDYPGLSSLLGQAAWQTLIEAYLDAHPPTSFTLRDLGLALPEFIATRPGLDRQVLCWDMARLERAYLEAFDAADAPPLDPTRIASIPEAAWQHARVELQPTARVLAVSYPVAELRRALREGHDPVIPEPAPRHVLIFRRDLQLFHEELAPREGTLLEALARGERLVPACEAVQAAFPDAAGRIDELVGGWFQSWAARGLVVGIDIADAARR